MEINNKPIIQVKLEYKDPEIGAFAVKCPDCELWFSGYELNLGTSGLSFRRSELKNSIFKCPNCCYTSSLCDVINIEETDMFDFRNNLAKKRIVWEAPPHEDWI